MLTSTGVDETICPMDIDAVQLLENLRVSKGFSIREIAQILGVSPATVCRELAKHNVKKEKSNEDSAKM
tara:strand:+ start:810 stop:1016 length:207 start_codon:yes stop_codon:yes gene_type:complete